MNMYPQKENHRARNIVTIVITINTNFKHITIFCDGSLKGFLNYD